MYKAKSFPAGSTNKINKMGGLQIPFTDDLHASWAMAVASNASAKDTGGDDTVERAATDTGGDDTVERAAAD